VRAPAALDVLPRTAHGTSIHWLSASFPFIFCAIGILSENLLSIVLELPPAPAALVLLGRWLETFSARSAAAFLRMTVAGPPGGLGDAGRAVVEPDAALLTGEVGRGADCCQYVSYWLWWV
jgi:hypothetical protein